MHVFARTLAFAAIGAVAIAGVAVAEDEDQISVDVVTKEGENAGTVTFRQLENGLLITVELTNLPAGPHGFHIHEKGVCEDDFQSAGGHFSPRDKEHGYDNEDGYHAGDLPNIYVGEDGTAEADIFVPLLTLDKDADTSGDDDDDGPFSLHQEDGTAIMVHEKFDDYVDMDSAGSRIACGVIIAPSE